MQRRTEAEIIDTLYDAALGSRAWSDANQSLMSHVDAQSLMMSVHQPKAAGVEVLGWLGQSTESLAAYPTFAAHDLWVAGYSDSRLFGRAAIGSHVVDVDVLRRSLIYNEYLRPQTSIFHMVGCVLALDGGHTAVLGVHRPHDGRDFVLGEARKLSRLVPHLQRALEVRRRLQLAGEASRSFYSVLDHLTLGVIVMDAAGRLLHVNAAADTILRGANGLTRTPDGLRAARKDDDRRLQALIGALRQRPTEARSAGGHVRIARPSGKRAYAVMLAPLGPSVPIPGRSSPALLAFISNPGRSASADLAVLADLFGFPPAEARLVLALLSGISPPDYARQRGITHNTVRTLLSRAMARTETRSQVELALLVASTIGGVAPAEQN